MRIAMPRKKGAETAPLFILLIVLTGLWGGCAEQPAPAPVYYISPFDRVWDSALGAAADAGVKITFQDRAAGVIRGTTNSADVTILVVTQADGRIRVEFSSKGPEGQDAGLSNRFTSFYNMRMGR
jgi:hypothetical protein